MHKTGGDLKRCEILESGFGYGSSTTEVTVLSIIP